MARFAWVKVAVEMPRDHINVLKNQERFAADQARAEGRAAPAQNSWLASHV